MKSELIGIEVEGGEFELLYSRKASSVLKADHWFITKDTKVKIEIPVSEFSLFKLNNSYKEIFTIPRGFLTDGSSVPRMFWSIFPKWDITRRAVIIHDYLLENPFSYYQDSDGNSLMLRKLSREYIDELFYQILLFDGVSKIRAKTLYYAVKFYSTFIALGETERASEEKKKIEKGYRET